MHPVLKAAIENPRFARPYGSERGEWGFEAGISGVDNFINMNNIGHAANDNNITPKPGAFEYGDTLIRANAKFARS